MLSFEIIEKYKCNIEDIYLELSKEDCLNYIVENDNDLISLKISQYSEDVRYIYTVHESIININIPSWIKYFIPSIENYKLFNYFRYDKEKKIVHCDIKSDLLNYLGLSISFDEKYNQNEISVDKIINFKINSDIRIVGSKIESYIKENIIVNSNFRRKLLSKWIEHNKN